MATTIVIGREELLAKLAKVRAKALREDGRIAREYKKKCDLALIEFRKKLAAAMKWYLKTAGEKRYSGIAFGEKSCPSLNTPGIDLAIKEIKLDSRAKFSLNTSHSWYCALTWLPESEQPKKTVCG